MLEKAIAKLKAEMEENKDNFYVQRVGEYLLQYLGRSPGAAEKILSADKSIGGSFAVMQKAAEKAFPGGLEAMRKLAEKNKVGSVGVVVGGLSDEDGYAVVLDYFGIKEEKKKDINIFDLLDELT